MSNRFAPSRQSLREHCTFRSRRPRWYIMFWLMVTAGTVDAADHCVASASALVAALSDASVSSEDNHIRIVAGSYDASGLDLVMDDVGTGDLIISGDWPAGCVGEPGMDSRNTVIAGAADADMTLLGLRRIELRALTFADFQNLQVVRKGDFGGHEIRVDAVRVINVGGMLVTSESAGPIDLRHVLIHDSGAPGSACLLTLGQQVDDSYSTTLLAQSTFAFNQGVAQICLNGAESSKLVRNNIFDGLDIGQHSVNVSIQPATFQRNRIQQLVGLPPRPDSSDNFTTSPGFIDAPARDFRLSAGSQAINRGYMVLPGGQRSFDAFGKQRWIDVRPDLGAIESQSLISDVFMVTNTNDAGFGSLRAAMDNANANADASIIRFNVPNGCVDPIKLTSALPTVTAPLWVDGYSQPASAANTSESVFNAKLCVRIRSDQAAFGNVFRAQNGDAPIRIEGIAFSGFNAIGGNDAVVMIQGAHESVIRGNQFGGSSEAGPLAPSDLDVVIGSGSRDVQVGGPSPAERNLFTHASSDLNIDMATGISGTQLIGNWFGLDVDGISDLRSSLAVLWQGSNGRVLGNRFAYNDIGLFIATTSATHNLIQDNHFGRDGAGNSAPLSSAIHVQGGSDNVIGAVADHAVGGNDIANALNSAITLIQAGAQPTGFRIRANRFGNTQSGLDIDLAGGGATANDAGDPDEGPNRGMNHPLLSAVSIVDGATDVTHVIGTVDTTPGNVLIDFYAGNTCTHSGRGRAEQHVGSVTTGNGGVNFQFIVAGDPYISATATDSSGNTSELSPCRRAPPTFSNGFE